MAAAGKRPKNCPPLSGAHVSCQSPAPVVVVVARVLQQVAAPTYIYSTVCMYIPVGPLPRQSPRVALPGYVFHVFRPGLFALIGSPQPAPATLIDDAPTRACAVLCCHSSSSSTMCSSALRPCLLPPPSYSICLFVLVFLSAHLYSTCASTVKLCLLLRKGGRCSLPLTRLIVPASKSALENRRLTHVHGLVISRLIRHSPQLDPSSRHLHHAATCKILYNNKDGGFSHDIAVAIMKGQYTSIPQFNLLHAG